MNCQKSGLDTVGSSISIVDLLRNDDASIDDQSSIYTVTVLLVSLVLLDLLNYRKNDISFT